MSKEPIIFAGTSHLELAHEVCGELGTVLGRLHLDQYPDGETNVQILENVRHRDIFILQSVARNPNHFLFELLIIIDAVKRASPRSITAIIPYLSYCRQDRKTKEGTPITAKLVANVLTAAGMTNLISFDLHADQVEGFYETTVDHLHCQQLLGAAAQNLMGEECIVVAPDIGAIKIAERMAKLLNTELVLLNKERLNSFEVEMTLIGEVKDKNVLIADDLCSTGGTIIEAATLCKNKGAKKIMVAVTHGLFVGEAIKKIASSPIQNLLITNTIECQTEFSPFVQTVSVAPMIAEAIRNSCGYFV